jgi:hypothetical protein
MRVLDQSSGADGLGKDGFVGYFTQLARRDPMSFCTLLLDILDDAPEPTLPEMF